MIPGAGSERGQRPTGCSAVASRAPGRGTEPAPVTLADPYGLPSPDDNGEPPPVSPPGEPDLPDGPTANRVHTPDPGHEHPGAAGALAGSLLNLEKSEMAQGLEAAPSGTLDPTFEAEAAVPATAASPPDSGIASAATRRARPASASNLPRPVCGWSWSTTTSCGCSTLAGGSPSSRSQGVSFEPGVHDRWLRQQA